jgi:hypothetical protein
VLRATALARREFARPRCAEQEGARQEAGLPRRGNAGRTGELRDTTSDGNREMDEETGSGSAPIHRILKIQWFKKNVIEINLKIKHLIRRKSVKV